MLSFTRNNMKHLGYYFTAKSISCYLGTDLIIQAFSLIFLYLNPLTFFNLLISLSWHQSEGLLGMKKFMYIQKELIQQVRIT